MDGNVTRQRLEDGGCLLYLGEKAIYRGEYLVCALAFSDRCESGFHGRVIDRGGKTRRFVIEYWQVGSMCQSRLAQIDIVTSCAILPSSPIDGIPIDVPLSSGQTFVD